MYTYLTLLRITSLSPESHVCPHVFKKPIKRAKLIVKVERGNLLNVTTLGGVMKP